MRNHLATNQAFVVLLLHTMWPSGPSAQPKEPILELCLSCALEEAARFSFSFPLTEAYYHEAMRMCTKGGIV